MHASAVSGVRSDGFQITGSPQTSASAAFQLQTATGKLKALIDGDGAERMPRLGEPVAGALRGDRAAVQLPRETDGEVADVDHLLHLAEPLLRDLPHLERDERAERLLLAPELLAEQAHELAALRRRARRATSSNAATARATAASVPAASVRWTRAISSPRDRRAHDEVAAAREVSTPRRSSRSAAVVVVSTVVTGASSRARVRCGGSARRYL